MKEHKTVAVLGAGAIGLPLGYFLSATGTNDVTYLVRGAKVEAMFTKTYKLFNYDSKKDPVKVVNGITCLATEPLSNPTDGSETPYSKFDLVIITLPTNLLEDDSGKAIIRGLAQRVKPHCEFLCLSPGFRMQEKVFSECGIDQKRVTYGLPLFLSHEVHLDTDNEEQKKLINTAKFPAIEGCDLAYHYLMSKSYVMLVSRKTKQLSKVLKNAKLGSVPGGGNSALEASTAMFLILNLALFLQDYPKSLNKSDKSFKAAIDAFDQIMKQYGTIGTVMRGTIGKNMMRWIDSSNRWASKPLTTEFLKYHHGKKVKDQNVKVISEYIEAGKAKKKPVDKIEAFVELLK